MCGTRKGEELLIHHFGLTTFSERKRLSNLDLQVKMIVKLTGGQWLWMMRAYECRVWMGGRGEDAVVKAAMKFRAETLLAFQNRALIRRVIYVKIQEFMQHIIEHINPANPSEKMIFFSRLI